MLPIIYGVGVMAVQSMKIKSPARIQIVIYGLVVIPPNVDMNMLDTVKATLVWGYKICADVRKKI